MTEKRYVSYSMLSIYDECPQKYKFHYKEGLAKLYRQEKPHLSFGESLHKALEDFFKIKNIKDRTKDKLTDILKMVWVGKGYLSQEEEQQHFHAAQHLLEIFYDTQDITVTPFRLEEFFRVPVGDFFLTGRIDRIDIIPATTDKVEIIDYKTGKFMPKQEDIDNDLQMSVYALAATKKFPRLYPEKISVYFFQHGQKLTTKRTPRELRAIEEDLINKVAVISSDSEFSAKESQFCKFCDYLLICPLMGLAASPSGVKTKVEEHLDKKQQLEEELKKTAEYYKAITQDLYAIHNYSLNISSTLDIKVLAQKVSDAFREISAASRSALFLWDEGEGKFIPLECHKMEIADNFYVEEQKVFDSVKKCNLGICACDSYSPDNPFSYIIDESLKIKNYIVASLMAKDKIFGLMILADISGPLPPTNKHLHILIMSLSDQSAISIYNALLYRYAIYDGLTKLFRGSHFQERLKQEMTRVARTGEKLTLIMADIDNFKKINDTFGHVEGDRILREVGREIKSKIRASDIAGRYGGEEFTVLLTATDRAGGVCVAEAIRKNIETNIRTSDNGQVTASFGVAEYNKEIRNPSDFIKMADDRLYEAKRSGKNRVVGL